MSSLVLFCFVSIFFFHSFLTHSFVLLILEIPVFLKGVSDTSVMEGETVSLEVLIDSDSDCQMEWFKNNNKLSEGGRISFVNDGHGRYSLIIRDAEDEDSGEYCCVAQNEAGKVSSAGKLSVESKYSVEVR